METIQTTEHTLNPANPADLAIIQEILPQSNAMRNITETNKFLHQMRFRLGMRDSLYSLIQNNPDYDDMPEFYNEGSNFQTLYTEDTVSRLKRDSARKYELYLEGRAKGLDYADSLAYANNMGETIKTKNRGKK